MAEFEALKVGESSGAEREERLVAHLPLGAVQCLAFFSPLLGYLQLAMGDLRDILGIQAPKAPTGPVMPGSKSKTAQGPPSMEPRVKKPRMSFDLQQHPPFLPFLVSHR